MGQPATALIDTGSAYTILNQGLLSAKILCTLPPCAVQLPHLLSASGNALFLTGTAKVKITAGPKSADLCVLIASGLPCGGIIGLDAFLALELLISVLGGRALKAINNGPKLVPYRQISIAHCPPAIAALVCSPGFNLCSLLAPSVTDVCTPRDLPDLLAGSSDILYEHLTFEACAQMLGLVTIHGI